MAKVNQEGEVYLTDVPTALAGRITKNEETGVSTAKCALCTFSAVGKKTAVAEAVESHFRRDHTTLG